MKRIGLLSDVECETLRRGVERRAETVGCGNGRRRCTWRIGAMRGSRCFLFEVDVDTISAWLDG